MLGAQYHAVHELRTSLHKGESVNKYYRCTCMGATKKVIEITIDC